MIRIVKLEIRTESLPDFIRQLDKVRHEIAAFAGCRQLHIYQDINEPTIIFTYSVWNHESDLNLYLHSQLFKSVWTTVKPLFSKPAQAWSLDDLKF